MVQDAQRVTEILAAVGNRNGVHRGAMEADVGCRGQAPPRDVQRRLGRIDAMQRPDPRCDEIRPTTPEAAGAAEPARTPEREAAPGIEPLGADGQSLEWKNREIAIEQLAMLVPAKVELVIGGPLVAEALHRRLVEIAPVFTLPDLSARRPRTIGGSTRHQSPIG